MSASPFLLEVIAYSLDSIVEQMGLTIMRSAYSSLIRDSLDFATAICDNRGRLLAQGYGIPMNLGAVSGAIAEFERRFTGTWSAGDVALLNDPYSGGTHLNDVFLMAPVFRSGSLQAFIVVVAHQTDVGGLTPGSMSFEAREIYQEGLRIPPVKLRAAGRADPAVVEILRANVRNPDQLLGDLEALSAACAIGETELLKALERHGADVFWEHVDALLDRTQHETAAAIANIPGGRYKFMDYLDDDGLGSGPVRISVTASVVGERLLVDFDGTSPQVSGSLNAPLSFSRSCALVAVKCALPATIRVNDGFFRQVSVTAPTGTVVHAEHPAACGNRGLTGYRIFDAVVGALAQAVPERLRAAGEGGTLSCGYEGLSNDGRSRFVFRHPLLGAWGGGPDLEGVDGVTNPASNLASPSLEVLEARFPVTYQRYGFVPDTGGPGAFRGGLAIRAEVRCDAPRMSVNVRSDRRDHPPYGLAGGRSGAPSHVWLERGDDKRLLPAKTTLTLNAGDRLLLELPGAGGYGDALLREPERVLDDVLEEKVSREHAAIAYGVVVDGATVDHTATQELRARMVGASRDAARGPGIDR